ncbi:MFS transporter [Legionella maceachernii]|uniref:Proline/glycine betaine transporter-like protein n=1 Tax=Legionella maceachernii TaxID=466 RepID=A0A0W0VVM8_9GAMM|nr:MFS transporter [Legionella maceachernii]KTD24104.1 proline/glycine betaine transporter-like protein [Legionella maceachernii]SJZ86248.1 MFS transporter, MHS family, proline/betaine transporter [Legionella maceachernii]SUO99058.1 Proline porter II [Legionella maceachernii]
MMKQTNLALVLALVFLEWLDFSLYLYLAKSVFANDFFPPSAYSLTLSFALFAAAYFARPVGGWFFGRKADLNGRRNPMVFSAALMGFATLGICLLPNYAQIGLLATWGLLILRVAQGLALGGEINTSAMFLVEHHPKKPLLAGSLVAASGAFGMFLGAAIAALLQYNEILWAWRIIFALVAMISLWVCQLRKRLRESPEFQKNLLSIKEIWPLYGRGLFNIAIVGAYVGVTVYLCNVFWVSFAIDQQLWSKTQCAWTGSIAQLLSALLAVPIAYFSQPSSVYRLMRASMVVITVAAPLLFFFTAISLSAGVLLSVLGYAIANALLCASLYYLLYLQLPAQYRCRGVSTIWALAASLGAISLPIAEQAVQLGAIWLPGFLVSAIAILSFLSLRNYHYQFKNQPNAESLVG